MNNVSTPLKVFKLADVYKDYLKGYILRSGEDILIYSGFPQAWTNHTSLIPVALVPLIYLHTLLLLRRKSKYHLK